MPGQLQGRTPLSGFYVIRPEGGWQHFIPLGPSHQDYLADHLIHGQVIAAGSVNLAVALAVAEEHFVHEGFVLENIQFLRPLYAD